MTRDDFFTLSLNPAHIPGIYNYCDRWCDRCPFANRCLVNSTTQQMTDDDPPRDPDPLVVHLKAQFDAARASIDRRWTGWNPHDLNTEPARDPVEEREHARRNERLRAHPTLREAHAYATLVRAWFDTETEGLKAHAEALARRAETDDLDSLESQITMDRVLDAIEIVRHDAYLIPVKLHRALKGRADFGEDGGPFDDPVQNDFNGSAKVALLSLDRAESAWRAIHKWYSGSGTGLLLAEHAALVRTMAEGEFPEARRFMRVGFDGARSA